MLIGVGVPPMQHLALPPASTLFSPQLPSCLLSAISAFKQCLLREIFALNRGVGVCGEVLGIQKKESGGAVVIHHL